MNTNLANAIAAATTPSPRGRYINFGGMGLTTSPQGQLDGLERNESADLILKEELGGREIARWSPSTPWTFKAIAEQLESAASVIGAHLPVAAYLGDVNLGSTEL